LTLHIAMVSEHASPLAAVGGVDAGGQNVHVAALALALAQRGGRVTVYTRRDSPDLDERVPMSPRVTVHHVDAGPAEPLPKDELLPHMPEFAAGLSRCWRADRPTIVHSHFWMSGLAALAAASADQIPVVHTFHALGAVKRRHQGSADTSPSSREETERNIMARAQRIIATCSDEVFELLRLGAHRHRLSVVPCGVDTTLFRPDGPARRRDHARRRLMSVGRLVPRKGVDTILQALVHLPDAELCVAGGPPSAQLEEDPDAVDLLRLADRLGVADRVDFLGRVARPDLPALYRSADAVVCVPWYEPFGIVPLEAMACGRPVVASAVGGLTDTVIDGVTGRHVPPRDPDALAAALEDLLADERLRRRMGRAGANRAQERYRWSRVASATVGVYADVLAGEPQRRWGGR